jgi:hypothetical protein
MDYIRLDPMIGSRPKTLNAGWWARQLYLQLLIVSGKYDLRGRIGPQYADSSWLAREWGLGDGDEPGRFADHYEAIAVGLRDLERNGLLARESDSWVIVGWEEFYGKKDYSTPRVRAHRARHGVDGTPIAPGETPETAETLPTHPPTDPLTTRENSGEVAKFSALWNGIAGSKLPRVTKFSASRRASALARLKEQGFANITRALEKMMTIPGLLGEAGDDRKWRADFDWFVKPESIENILEGKYDRWGTSAQGKAAVVLEDPRELYKEEEP